MNWPARFCAGVVSVGLLWLCSSAVGALLACGIADALPAWPIAASLLGLFVLSGLWYVLLFFGCWIALLPPATPWHGWFFSWVAILAGLLASDRFQTLGPWDFDHNSVPNIPPPVQMVSLTTLVCCLTAVLSTALCSWVVRRWFRYPPFNTALPVTGTGKGDLS